jgi:hypothetical protein
VGSGVAEYQCVCWCSVVRALLHKGWSVVEVHAFFKLWKSWNGLQLLQSILQLKRCCSESDWRLCSHPVHLSVYIAAAACSTSCHELCRTLQGQLHARCAPCAGDVLVLCVHLWLRLSFPDLHLAAGVHTLLSYIPAGVANFQVVWALFGCCFRYV